MNDRRKLLTYLVLILAGVALASVAGAGYQFHWLVKNQHADDASRAESFWRAVWLATGTALVVIFAGGTLLLRATSPFIRRLQESEVRTRTIVDMAMDGIVTIDERGRVESFNLAAERLFGYRATDVIGKKIQTLLPELAYWEAETGLDPQQIAGTAFAFAKSRELTGRRKNGTSFPLELSASEAQLADRRIITGIVRDITERKQAQDQTRRHVEMLQSVRAGLEAKVGQLLSINGQLDKLSTAGDRSQAKTIDQIQRAHRELDHFVRALSHDMSANFMVLESSFRELKTSCQTAPLASLTHGLAHVEACLRESKRFMDDLVTLAKTGSVQMEPTRLSLKRLLNEVLFEQAELLEARAVKVIIEPGLPEVWCNEGRVKQVLTNLVRNAIKHGCDSQAPVITIAPLRRDENHESTRFEWVRIHDNGQGIPPDACEKIFLPGHRLPSANPEGSGMGLAIVKKIVDHYGGVVYADPHCRQGAAFVLSMPSLPMQKTVTGDSQHDAEQLASSVA